MKKLYIIAILLLFRIQCIAQETEIYPFEYSANFIVNLFDESSKESKISISKNGEIEITQAGEKIKIDITTIPIDSIFIINDDDNIPAIRFKNDKSYFLNISQIPKNKREKLYNAFKNLQKVIIHDKKIAENIKDNADEIYKSPEKKQMETKTSHNSQ